MAQVGEGEVVVEGAEDGAAVGCGEGDEVTIYGDAGSADFVEPAEERLLVPLIPAVAYVLDADAGAEQVDLALGAVTEHQVVQAQQRGQQMAQGSHRHRRGRQHRSIEGGWTGSTQHSTIADE